MSKYYVQSGNIKQVISAKHIESPEDAACEVMLSSFSKKGNYASSLIIVSEVGFNFDTHDITEDYVYVTEKILKKVGFIFLDKGENEDVS